jgi:hypothetical protein
MRPNTAEPAVFLFVFPEQAVKKNAGIFSNLQVLLYVVANTVEDC